MSRRDQARAAREQADLDSLLARYAEGGRGEQFVNWEALAEGEGILYLTGSDPDTGERWVDASLILDELRRRFLTEPHPEYGPSGPLAQLLVACQRCGTRIDALTVTSWNVLETGAIEITGRGGVRVDQTAPGPLKYSCPCGRGGIQVSRSRAIATLRGFLGKPVWGKGDEGDGYYVPPGRRGTVRV